MLRMSARRFSSIGIRKSPVNSDIGWVGGRLPTPSCQPMAVKHKDSHDGSKGRRQREEHNRELSERESKLVGDQGDAGM